MTRTGTMLIALVVGCFAANAQGVGGVSKAAEEKTVNLCSTCHGPRGISTSPEFPILAAQQKEYIVNQLHAFRQKSRSEKDAHDFMWGIAAGLDDAMISEIAIFYSAQPPAPGRPREDLAQIANGKRLFDQGSAERGIPACASCHGEAATGNGMFPRLAGQHAKYVTKQLMYIQSLVRAAPVMHGIVKDLSAGEIQALAAYVQSL
ncbi:MAG: c-type cytochrome [Deltaproteobacteria bacterium]|jgi:cytochrome c553